MGKKKIAFVINSMTSGGAERVISILSNNLIDTYKVFIITIANTPSFYELHYEVTVVPCSKSGVSKGIIDAIRSNYRRYKEILKILRKNRINLCIGFTTSNNILSVLAAKSCGIPVIISERNNPYVESQKLNGFWKSLRKIIYPKTDVLVVQTSLIKSFYSNLVEDSKLVTIPNPINPDFEYDPKIDKQKIILNVGRLAEQKGQDVLIKAFAKVKAEGWSLQIIGKGEKHNELQSLIEELQMQDQVFLMGTKANIEEYYQKSSVFVFSSRFEGFPNALMEAMFFGLACISTDCPTGPSEMIIDGSNGFLVPVDEIDIMASRLNELIQDEQLRKKMGEAARKTMESYHVQKILGQWEIQISRLLKVEKTRI